jgi:putative endonuclease
MKNYYVYILANKKNGVLYTGFTDDIERRVIEHKTKIFKGFTNKYNIDKLEYYEKTLTLEEAQLREKRIKKWNRMWKIDLIEKNNPEWIDLSMEFTKILTNGEKMNLLFGKKINKD